MTNLKLRTKAEYVAAFQALRDEAKRLDNSPVSSPSQAREQGKQIKALRDRADYMERQMYVDGTLKAEFQQAEIQRQQEIDTARYKTALEVDKRLNPAKYVDHNTAAEYLSNSVDLFSGLDHAEKVGLIANLLGGQRTGKDIEGNSYIQSGKVRATLHNDTHGSYVSFVNAANGE